MAKSAHIPPALLVLLLWLAGLTASAQFAKFSVIFPVFQQLYPDSGPELGFLVSVISLLGMLFGVVGGLLVAKIGFRTVLIASLIMGGGMSLVQSLSPGFGLMLASRTIEGAAHLGIVIAAPTYIAQLSSDGWRPAAMNLWGTFFGVSFALMGWLGIPLVESRGFEALFAGHGLVMLVLAAVFIAVLPRVKGASTSQDVAGLGGLLKLHWQIYRSPFKSAAAIGWLFYTLTFVALLTSAAEIVDPDWRATVLTVAPLVSIASSMTLGVFLLRYLTSATVLAMSFLAAALFAPLLYLMPGNGLVFIALFFVLGLVQGVSFAAIPEINEKAEDQAHAVGALAQTGNIGNLLGTPLMLAILAWAGLGGLVVSLVVIYLSGMTAHLLLATARRRHVTS